MFAAALWGGAAVAAAGPSGLPYQSEFGSGALDPPWERQTTEGGTIDLKDGGVWFRAKPESASHIQRPAGPDLISVEGEILRGASIYLVWDADNWCSVGKASPTPFGRFTSTVVAAGKANEADHRGVQYHSIQWVRIKLGTNFVAFQYSLDGRDWGDLRSIERPEGYAGAPKLVAAGKTYDLRERPFAGPGQLASWPESTPTDGFLRALRVSETPHAEVTLDGTALEALRNPPGEPVNAILADPKREPTFEEIAKHYPPMKFPREVVGVPFHPLDIGVNRLGQLDVSPWTAPLAWLEVGDPPVQLGREGATFERRLLHGYLPVLTLKAERNEVDYELTVFGWSEGMRADKDLVAYARLVACPAAGASVSGKAALAWDDGKSRRELKGVAGRNGAVQWALKFRYPEPKAAVDVDAAEFQAKETEVAAHWEKLLAPASLMDIPDRRVAEAYRAWFAYSMLNTDMVNGFPEPHDGAGFYEEMFGWSVTLHATVLDEYGFSGHAERILDSQLHFQKPDGSYTQACGLTDPGALLAGLARHYEVTGDKAWLRRVSPNIIKLCAWLAEMRKSAPKDGPLRGLIKFRPYNDYQDPTFNYLGNSWCAKGMRDIAAALKGVGIPEGETYAAEGTAYCKDVLNSMETTAFDRDGMTHLEMEPDTQRLFKLSKYRGGDYYGLLASNVLETELIPPDDKRTAWIVDMLEKKGGIIAGLAEFSGGMDHAYTYGYLLNALKHDDPRKALLGFWSMLAYGMTRDTYSPVEITLFQTGENHLTLPHLFSCTEQLRLLRNLLIREEGDTLWLGQGIPRAWLEPGKHVGATAAPTSFGPVTYRIDAEADGTMRARIDPPTRRVPATIKLRLRHPEGRKIASAEASGPADFEAAGETITLKGLAAPIDLRIRFADK
jgi:hypothetical protein